jgi:predicted phage gp36 major capsid-like protein
MRTTVNIDDQLLAADKHLAVEQGVSLGGVIENALGEALARPQEECPVVRLVTCSGNGVKPGIDLDNFRSLLDVMDDLS